MLNTLVGRTHPDRLGHDHLVRGRRLAALQMGCRRSGAVFRVGVDCHGAATFDHGDELGKMTSLAVRSEIERRVEPTMLDAID